MSRQTAFLQNREFSSEKFQNNGVSKISNKPLETRALMRIWFDELTTFISHHVRGQNEAIRYIVSSLFSGVIICIAGPPGTGKTKMIQTLNQGLGVPGEVFTFHPEVMVTQITGYRSLNLETHKLEFTPGLFTRGNVVVGCDDFTRGSLKSLTALLEVLNSGEVTVDGTIHKTSDILTVIMTTNHPESLGVNQVPDALANRIGAHIWVEGLKSDKKSQTEILADAIGHNIHVTAEPQLAPNPDQLWGHDVAEDKIRAARHEVNKTIGHIDSDVMHLAATIVNHFSGAKWINNPSTRNGVAMVKLAHTLSLAETGKSASLGYIWEVAEKCLLELRPRDYMTTKEVLTEIRKDLKTVYDKVDRSLRSSKARQVLDK